MINVVTILFEGITAWICLHLVFGKKIERKLIEVVYLIVYVMLFSLCSFDIISKGVYFIFILWNIIWSGRVFRNNNLMTVVKTITSILLLGFFEAVSMYIMFPMLKVIDDIAIKCMITSFCMIILSYSVFLIMLKRKYNIQNISIGKSLIIFILCMFVLWIYMKIEFEKEGRADLVYAIFFILMAIAFVSVFREQRIFHELEKSKIKDEMNSLYGNAYEDLLRVVRSRQHDYKNQLSALSSIHIVTTEKNEISGVYKDYLKVLEYDSKFDTILTKCNNPIIAGYLYNLCIKYQNSDIVVEPSINYVSSQVDTRTKHIIEMIGIMMQNAKEYIEENSKIERKIKILLCEKEKLEISIENPSDYVNYETIERMFEEGYSTKGEGRGLGLSTLKTITQVYKGKLSVINVSFNDSNWLKITVEI